MAPGNSQALGSLCTTPRRGLNAGSGDPRPSRLARVLQSIPSVREVFAQQGVEPETSTPAEFQRMIDAELTRWARDVKTLGIL